MTLYIAWWYLPTALIAAGLLAALVWPNHRYEFLGWPAEAWPITKVAVVVACLLVGVGWMIGGLLGRMP